MSILYMIFGGLQDWLVQHLGKSSVIVERAVNILLFIALFKLLILIGNYLVSAYFDVRIRTTKSSSRRYITLKSLFHSIWRYAMYFFLTAQVLQQLGLSMTAGSILATAGIGGLALGFGAQSLIKDVITGAFILFENQIAVGDYVTIAGCTGTVEAVLLRTTQIRSATGELFSIPNGSIDKVTNFSRGEMLAVVDVSVAYEADIDRAEELIRQVCTKYAQENEEIIVEEPQYVGVHLLGENAIILRVLCKTKPLQQLNVERGLRKAIIDTFRADGFQTPYKKIVLIDHTAKEQ